MKKQQSAAELFKLYKSMGTQRSLVELSEMSGVKLEIIEAYAEAGDWELKLLMELDEGNGAASSERELSKHVHELQENLFNQISKALQNMATCSVGLPFDVTSAKDFSLVAKAYETLVKASLIAKTAFLQTDPDTPDSWLALVKEVYKVESRGGAGEPAKAVEDKSSEQQDE